ncbi:response regulator transcription factor [Persicirhabdus sediminis]|uniref:Response regulator transcription factor n=1 Tax=Persicirhabdus sediminis TaxID=454144 RepID=A0A8J7MFJ3_9BACT|nr:response regulator transcription factor [Persicirhabdus sediminis]MBK1791821.1 response regulator transcription factor [Persicirhabdus sediminis]
MKVLIVEDEVDIADLISFNLKRKDYETFMAHDGIRGLEMAQEIQPDIVILDLMMPGMDGRDVFKQMKRDARTMNIPVIMLTALGQTEDRIKGLELGADDYLTKPFSTKELVLRVEAILKRTTQKTGSTKFKLGPFNFDKNTLSFYIHSERVDLTSTEFKLMLYLCERGSAVQDRHQILREVWGYSDDVHTRTLDTHMKRLRNKLGEHAHLLETVRGKGYRINAE